jgi:hypothetical protein
VRLVAPENVSREYPAHYLFTFLDVWQFRLARP